MKSISQDYALEKVLKIPDESEFSYEMIFKREREKLIYEKKIAKLRMCFDLKDSINSLIYSVLWIYKLCSY